MPDSLIRLVAVDGELGRSIRDGIRDSLGFTPSVADPKSARTQLRSSSPGMWVLGIDCERSHREIVPLIHESRLQHLAWDFLWLDARRNGSARNVSPYQPYLGGFFRWPDDVDGITRTIRDYLSRRHHEPRRPADDVEAMIESRFALSTPSLMPLVEQVALTARHDVTVLLTGETGTGKTYLAKLIHDCSPRKDEPFVAVPCGALPANLIESAFFGHVKGAFTGADRNKDGKFSVAGRGTILLDEIDTLSPETQAALLKVIECGEFEPVGSNVTQRSEARLIVTSNVDLEEACRSGKFREDLYYRLNVMSFHLPPLRERAQDVAPLVGEMAARYCTKFGKDLFEVGLDTIALLEAYRWPGNLRQMENVLQQAVLMSNGPILLPEHLPPILKEGRVNGRANGHGTSQLIQGREATEKSLIRQALERNHNNRSRAAKDLRISRVTLYKKMKKYGLDGVTA